MKRKLTLVLVSLIASLMTAGIIYGCGSDHESSMAVIHGATS